MQRKGVKLQPARGGEGQTKDFDHHDDSTKTQEYRRVQRFRRGEGSKSSPTTTRSRLKTPSLNLRSRSEGNLIAAQIVDLKTRRELEVHHEKTLQLPKLRGDLVSANATLADHELEQKKSTTTARVKETSSGSSDIKSGRFAILRYNAHRRMFNEHIQKEEREYETDKTKRDILLKWLTEQKMSDKS